MLFPLRSANKQLAQALSDRLIARARESVFFRDLAVCDTMDGRFDMVALHGFLLLERLKAAGRDEIGRAHV